MTNKPIPAAPALPDVAEETVTITFNLHDSVHLGSLAATLETLRKCGFTGAGEQGRDTPRVGDHVICPKHGPKFGFCEDCAEVEEQRVETPHQVPIPEDVSPAVKKAMERFNKRMRELSQEAQPLPALDVTESDLNIGNCAADTAMEMASQKQIHAYIKNAVAELECRERQLTELSRTKEGWSELYNFMFFSKRLLDEEDAAQNCGDHCRNSCRWCGLRDTVTRADLIYPEATR